MGGLNLTGKVTDVDNAKMDFFSPDFGLIVDNSHRAIYKIPVTKRFIICIKQATTTKSGFFF